MIEDLLEPEPISIVDVGAAFFGHAPPYQVLLDRKLGRVTAFEPDARQQGRLAEHLGASGRVLPYALGDGAEHTLHICHPNTGMTSLLKPDTRSCRFFNLFEAFSEVLSTEPIATTRLDDVEELEAVDFLKMDIQGSELMVLRNGRAKLASCVFVQTEVSFIPLYEKQAGFGEIDVEMRGMGFLPHAFAEMKAWSIAPIRRNNNPKAPFNQLLEGDAVYMADIVFSRRDAPALRKMATVAHHCYRSPDLAGRCIIELQDRGEVPGDTLGKYLVALNAKLA